MVFFEKADASSNDQSTAILLLLLLRPTALQQQHRVSSAAEKNKQLGLGNIIFPMFQKLPSSIFTAQNFMIT